MLLTVIVLSALVCGGLCGNDTSQSYSLRCLTTSCSCSAHNHAIIQHIYQDGGNWNTLSIPPNTGESIRNDISRNILLGVPKFVIAGERISLRAFQCKGLRHVHLSTSGMDFRGNVLSLDGKKSVLANIEWNTQEDLHQIILPWWLPGDWYTINIILLQVGGQGLQDPPCFNNLTVRTHCKQETLWFNHIANATFTLKVKESHRHKPIRHKCDPWMNAAGMWRQDQTGIWNWDNPFCEKIKLDPVLPPIPLSSKECVFMGDSTFVSIHENLRKWLNASDTCKFHLSYLSENANMVVKDLRSRKRAYNETPTVVIYNAGLHATCYANMKEELTRMRPVLENLVTLADHVIVRSTVALTYLPGMDFVKRKCLYYTEQRILTFNAEVEKMCHEFGIPFWDVYTMTAASFPFSVQGITDGNHYCKMKTSNGNLGYACREEMMMLFSILTKFMAPS